ncbi:MAG: 6-phosphofructokinase [Chloroflexota bacterium]
METIGVLTSGGDAPGMNAAVRAVVRRGLELGINVYAIYEGYLGIIHGGDWIKEMDWSSVGGILHKGGTIIGSARCQEFRTREGRQKAVMNLVERGIEGLVIIGGDGSLTGANVLRQEWSSHLDELVESGKVTKQQAKKHQFIGITGLVGSIDNDMFGTDMTIGADTALHRITDAVDAIGSTAASHQRAFVIEVMGRNAGYLAMMSALASGADWVLIPESPPDLDEWEAKMCEVLRSGRDSGRRDSIVIVAEGAVDQRGNPITCGQVKQILEERLGEDTRVTILGHVQRGGSPSAFDRNLSTLLGVEAVDKLLTLTADSPSLLLGIQGNRIVANPLMECVAKTHAVNEAITNLNFERAMELRGRNFSEAFRALRTLVRAVPHDPVPGKRRLRLAILNAGAPSPGMNTAVRAAVRIGLDKGHHMFTVRDGFKGLRDGQIEEFDWMSVNGWAAMGGSELGTNRTIPEKSDFYAIARNIEEFNIEGLLVIGGWSAYDAAVSIYKQRPNFPAFEIPLVCLPASINNNLPGTELCVGADTALNCIVEAVDKIKQSAVASNRCFIVEVMGRYCGYLALMSALASGAERVYLHEEGVTLKDLQRDVDLLVEGFSHGKRLGVMIRNENANDIYDTNFIRRLLEEEGGDLFEVRQSILGHLQQGGDPSPFDRVLATRYAVRSINFLEEQATRSSSAAASIGMSEGGFQFSSFDSLLSQYDTQFQRPQEQWWMSLRPIVRMLAQPNAKYFAQNQ